MMISDATGRSLGGVSRLIESVGKNNSDQCATVEIVRIDDVVPPGRKVSILQLDVEGFEQQALSGAIETIKRCKPILILENLPERDWLNEHIYHLGYHVVGKVHSNSILEYRRS